MVPKIWLSHEGRNRGKKKKLNLIKNSRWFASSDYQSLLNPSEVSDEHVEIKHIQKKESHIVREQYLHVGIDDQLRQTQNLARQMESVTETRFLTLLRRQRLDRLQVEIVIQMKVVQVLTMDQQVEHVVALATHLQASLDPVQRGDLEELGLLECAEEVLLVERLWWAVVECVEDIALEELLIGDTHFDGVVTKKKSTKDDNKIGDPHESGVKKETSSTGV